VALGVIVVMVIMCIDSYAFKTMTDGCDMHRTAGGPPVRPADLGRTAPAERLFSIKTHCF
jgi:hypothetical protein